MWEFKVEPTGTGGDSQGLRAWAEPELERVERPLPSSELKTHPIGLLASSNLPSFKELHISHSRPLPGLQPIEKVTRSFPPGACAADMTSPDNKNGKRDFLPASDEVFFSDYDIVSVGMHPKLYSKMIPSSEIAYGQTIDGRVVLQQQARNSSVNTCVEMLAADLGFKINDQALKTGEGTPIKMAMKRKGLNCVAMERSSWPDPLVDPLSEVARAVKARPGILTLGSHAVIVDSYNGNRKDFLIRDPYHGWEILVKETALAPHVEHNLKFYQADLSDKECFRFNAFPPSILERLKSWWNS